MRKILSVCLALALIVMALPLGVFEFPVSAEKEGYYTYSIENGEATIKETFSYMNGDVIIPSTLGGCPVTHIAKQAFWQLGSDKYYYP